MQLTVQVLLEVQCQLLATLLLASSIAVSPTDTRPPSSSSFRPVNLPSFLMLRIFAVALLCAAPLSGAAAAAGSRRDNSLSAVILSGSRYAFNYRHSAGANAVSALLRSRGVPEQAVLLAVAEGARGPFAPSPPAIDATDAEVGPPHCGGDAATRRRRPRARASGGAAALDLRGAAVSAGTLLRALSGRGGGGGGGSGGGRLLIYLTGHGGDGFLKLSDKGELPGGAVAAALSAALRSGRWSSVTAMLDTCQAATLAEGWAGAGGTPGALALASSVRGEDSLSFGNDAAGVGQALGDGFSTALWRAARAAPRPRLRPAEAALGVLLPPSLPLGPLSLRNALKIARRGGGCVAAPPAAAATVATLDDVVAAMPASLIGSTVTVAGAASASLDFYAAVSAARRTPTPAPLVSSPAARLAAALLGVLALNWRDHAVCAPLATDAAGKPLSDFLEELVVCGGAGSAAGVATALGGGWPAAAVPAAAALSRCRDARAHLAACLAGVLDAAMGAAPPGDAFSPLEHELLRWHRTDDVFGGGR